MKYLIIAILAILFIGCGDSPVSVGSSPGEGDSENSQVSSESSYKTLKISLASPDCFCNWAWNKCTCINSLEAIPEYISCSAIKYSGKDILESESTLITLSFIEEDDEELGYSAGDLKLTAAINNSASELMCLYF